MSSVISGRQVRLLHDHLRQRQVLVQERRLVHLLQVRHCRLRQRHLRLQEGQSFRLLQGKAGRSKRAGDYVDHQRISSTGSFA